VREKGRRDVQRRIAQERVQARSLALPVLWAMQAQ
jgi:hypothetical protein